MDTDLILYAVKNNVATITLNRPERMNSFTDAMLIELAKAIKSAERDANVRVVVLTGAGKAFCAGQDIGGLDDQARKKPNMLIDHLAHVYRPVIATLYSMEKPSIAAVNGAAAGAGASLALVCDLRIMSDKSFVSQAFSSIALVPDCGSTWLMARQVGYSRAFQLAIEAERITAARCVELGLANRVVSAETLAAEAQTWAEHLAQRAPIAIALTKRAMNRAMTSTFMEAFDYEAQLQQTAAETADFAEGVKAFAEKRAAKFAGR